MYKCQERSNLLPKGIPSPPGLTLPKPAVLQALSGIHYYYKKGPGILFRVISFLTFMIPSYIEDREEETLWREEMFVCNECDWTQKCEKC